METADAAPVCGVDRSSSTSESYEQEREIAALARVARKLPAGPDEQKTLDLIRAALEQFGEAKIRGAVVFMSEERNDFLRNKRFSVAYCFENQNVLTHCVERWLKAEPEGRELAACERLRDADRDLMDDAEWHDRAHANAKQKAAQEHRDFMLAYAEAHGITGATEAEILEKAPKAYDVALRARMEAGLASFEAMAAARRQSAPAPPAAALPRPRASAAPERAGNAPATVLSAPERPADASPTPAATDAVEPASAVVACALASFRGRARPAAPARSNRP